MIKVSDEQINSMGITVGDLGNNFRAVLKRDHATPHNNRLAIYNMGSGELFELNAYPIKALREFLNDCNNS